MPPGWGRRAAGKIDHKLEDDELFKEIGGQLDASNFDYSQWQRTGKKPGPPGRRDTQTPARRRPPPPQQKRDAISAVFDRPITVTSGRTTATTRRAASAGTSCHGHTHGKKDTPPTIDEAAEKKKNEAIKILQLRISARRQTIQEYRMRQMEILEENMTLKDLIDNMESDSHEDVKKLLRKYERFRGGIAALNDQFGKELAEAKKSREETRKTIAHGLAKIQSEVDAINNELAEQQKELNILLNYKDKEYPVKALIISDLQKDIEQLKVENQGEEGELNHIVETEIDKLRKKQYNIKQNITEKATKEAMSKMHKSLQDMALANKVMEKEIEFHSKEISELEESNRCLDAEVKVLLRDPKTSIRMQMFPEFFPQRPKCTPDMDVVLDIPTQEWLPI